MPFSKSVIGTFRSSPIISDRFFSREGVDSSAALEITDQADSALEMSDMVGTLEVSAEHG